MSIKIKMINIWNYVKGATQSQISAEALERFEEIQGGNSNTFESRVLSVQAGEEDIAEALGAVFDTEKKAWVVPDHLDTKSFRDFWPEIPEDLRAPNRRQLLTKSGSVREMYVHPEDEARGSDSLALPWMFAILPMLSILSFAAVQILGLLGALPAVALAALTVPYLISIAQSEGAKEAFKCFFILYLLPLALSLGVAGLPAKMLGGIGIFSMLGNAGGVGGVVLEFFLFIGLFSLFAIGSALYAAASTGGENSKNYRATLGTKFDVFRSLFKFGLVMLFLMFLTHTVTGMLAALNIPVLKHLVYFKPIAFYILASLYPLYYANNDAKMRGQELNMQSQKFKGGHSGSLATVGEQGRVSQYVEAMKDKTPLINIAKALGVSEKKLYPYAPGAGKMMKCSIRDLSQHSITFGSTGAGKTESWLYPLAVQLRNLGNYGLLFLDGKGVMGNDIRPMVDIMIEPGIRFAPFQGLNAEQVFAAMTDNGQTKKGDAAAKGKSDVWEGGGHDLFKYSLAILEAAIEVEKKAYRDYLDEFLFLDEEMVDLALQLELAKRDGSDTGVLEQEMELLQYRLDDLQELMTKQREFYWTPWSLQNMRRRIVSVIPGKHEEASNMPNASMLKLAMNLGLVLEEDEDGNFTNIIKQGEFQPWAHPEVLREGSPLNTALIYALNEYPTFKSNFTSSFHQSFNRLINPLLEGKKLCDWEGEDEQGCPIAGTPWHMIEEGVDVSAVAYGKSLSFNLPETVFGDAGVLIQTLVKSRIYNIVKARNSTWAEEGQSPICVIIDECQEIVGDAEIKLLPMCRSLGMYVNVATQTINSLSKVFGAENALLFSDTFQTLISFRSSHNTYEYISNRFGTAMLTVFEEKTASIDYTGAVRLASDSAYNEMSHPNSAVFRKIDTLGGGNLTAMRYTGGTIEWQGAKAQKLGGEILLNGMQIPCGGSRVVQPIAKPEELSTYLNIRGQAICQVQRGGSKMIDFAKFDHIGVSDIHRIFNNKKGGSV